MQRFKQNDAVFILPKFAHLYPGQSATVIDISPDPFRSMFNVYTLEFADRSTAKLFEFQMIEEEQNYRTFVASLVFDSRQQGRTVHTRGSASEWQIIFRTQDFDLDMNIQTSKSRASIMGQVLERRTKTLLEDVQISLMNEGMPLRTVISDSLGEFEFSDVPRGSLNILAIIPQNFSRILAAVAI
jgi:hypothetical protein